MLRGFARAVGPLFLSLALSNAWALPVSTCRDLLSGVLGWTREIKTLRVLNQGCNPTCGLHTAVALVENSVHSGSEHLPLSAAFVQHHMIRARAKSLYGNPSASIEWMGSPAEAIALMRESGAIPDKAWKPKIPPGEWNIEGEIEPLLRKIAEGAQKEGLSFVEYMRHVNGELERIYGLPPESFRSGWFGLKSQDAAIYRDTQTLLGDPKLRLENLTIRSDIELSHGCDVQSCTSYDEALERVAASIDRGQPVAAGFDVHVGERNKELGLWTAKEGSALRGNHGAVLVGYLRDETGKIVAWKGLNSWGDANAKGFFIFPDAFLRQRLTDFTLIRRD